MSQNGWGVTSLDEAPSRGPRGSGIPVAVRHSRNSSRDNILLTSPTIKNNKEHALDDLENKENAAAAVDLITAAVERGRMVREAAASQDCSTTDNKLGALPASPNAPHNDLTLRQVMALRGSEAFCVNGESSLNVSERAALFAAERTVDLVAGGTAIFDSAATKVHRMLNNYSENIDSSLSEFDDEVSEFDDPAKADSLLEELFYKYGGSQAVQDEDDDIDELLRSDDEGNNDIVVVKDEKIRKNSLTASSVELPPAGSKSSSRRPTKKQRQLSRKPSPGRGRSPNRKTNLRGTRSGSSESSASRVSFEPPYVGGCDANTFTCSSEDSQQASSNRNAQTLTEGLSVERLTLLGRVKMARVLISHIVLRKQLYMTDNTDRRRLAAVRGGGRPPPAPAQAKPATFYVEYQFPVIAASRDRSVASSSATEVVRAVSKRIQGKHVIFEHRTTFPILFDGISVQRWWQTKLNLKVMTRIAGQRGSPNMVGSCSLPLKLVLKSDTLCIERTLVVQETSKDCNNSAQLGQLTLSVELASDAKDFGEALAKTRLMELRHPQDKVPLFGKPKSLFVTKAEDDSAKRTAALVDIPDEKQTIPQSGSTKLLSKEQASSSAQQQANIPLHQQHLYEAQRVLRQEFPDIARLPQSHHEPITLLSLLMVSEGRNLTVSAGDQTPLKLTSSADGAAHHLTNKRDCVTHNCYLIAKMFWCADTVASQVCWGSATPNWNFSQVAPLLLTAALLERLRRNFMIVEVWNKHASAARDSLIGIVKLPLHQFYLSYRDASIAHSLLASQFPVVSCDGWVSVKCPFSGRTCGELRITLMLGSSCQVGGAQRLKESGADLFHQQVEDNNYLLAPSAAALSSFDNGLKQDNVALTEHIFEMSLEGLRQLQLPEGSVWGEADVFVQYYFPTLTSNSAKGGTCAPLELRASRSAATMAVPEPALHDLTRHRLALASETPLQRELVACVAGTNDTPGLPVELWLRFYLPNVREQCAAKGTLPLGKLCALVGMNQGNSETAAQRMSVKLYSLDALRQEIATLDLTMTYRRRHILAAASSQHKVPRDVMENAQQATLCVNIIRASGLQHAALLAASASASVSASHQDSPLHYAAMVGLNAYCRFRLSFERAGEHSTRAVARTFTPEWGHSAELVLPLLWPQQDALSAIALAELLEEGHLEVQLWHQAPAAARQLGAAIHGGGSEREHASSSLLQRVERHEDILLGTLALPLAALLVGANLNGWFALCAPDLELEKQLEPRCVGGVELSVRWMQRRDREKVLEAARQIGFTSLEGELDSFEAGSDTIAPYRNITVSLKSLDVAELLCLRSGQHHLPPNSSIYLRYRVYDRVAVQTPSYTAIVTTTAADAHSSGRIQLNCQHRRAFSFRASSAFLQWLLESRLEIQVWLQQHHKQEHASPNKAAAARDMLLGSIYLELSCRPNHRSAGLFPLLRAGCDSLVGSSVRAALTITSAERPLSGQEELAEDDAGHVEGRIEGQRLVQPRLPNTLTFPVQLLVEQAARLQPLPSPLETASRTILPSTTAQDSRYYVTVDTAECTGALGSFVTPLLSSSCGGRVMWRWERQVRLDKDVLKREDKTMKFKIWQRPEGLEAPVDLDAIDVDVTLQQKPAEQLSQDRLIGFATVDLAPLVAGMRQLLGWYNVTDYRGEVRGQLKLGVTPLDCANFSPDKASCARADAVEFDHAFGINDGKLLRDSLRERSLLPDSSNTSRSILFKNLRGHLADLDALNARLNARLLGSNESIDAVDNAAAPTSTKAPVVDNSRLPPPVPVTAPRSMTAKEQRVDEKENVESDIDAVLRRARELLDATEQDDYLHPTRVKTAVDLFDNEENFHRTDNEEEEDDEDDDDEDDEDDDDVDDEEDDDVENDILQVRALNDDVDSFHGGSGDVHQHKEDVDCNSEERSQVDLADESDGDDDTSDSLRTDDLLWENEEEKEGYFEVESATETLTPATSLVFANQEMLEAEKKDGEDKSHCTTTKDADEQLLLNGSMLLNDTEEEESHSPLITSHESSVSEHLSPKVNVKSQVDSTSSNTFTNITVGAQNNPVLPMHQTQRRFEQAAAARAVLNRLERANAGSSIATEQVRPSVAPLPDSVNVNADRLLRILTTKYSAAGSI